MRVESSIRNIAGNHTPGAFYFYKNVKLQEDMKRNTIIEIICALFIILFVYAALTKLLDYEKFQVQIGQSPLLTAFVGWIAWIVPVAEILISIMLVFARLRLVGLYAAFSLMVMFTTYIICILTLSLYIPCSCGGILEKLGWTEHLIFNIVFIILAAVAVLISYRKKKTTTQIAIA